MWLFVHEVAESVLVEVEKDADDTPAMDPALRSVAMFIVMHEPAPMIVNVHAPRFVVLTCKEKMTILNEFRKQGHWTMWIKAGGRPSVKRRNIARKSNQVLQK